MPPLVQGQDSCLLRGNQSGQAEIAAGSRAARLFYSQLFGEAVYLLWNGTPMRDKRVSLFSSICNIGIRMMLFSSLPGEARAKTRHRFQKFTVEAIQDPAYDLADDDVRVVQVPRYQQHTIAASYNAISIVRTRGTFAK